MEHQDIVELIKEKVRIEDVIEADGYPLPKRGRYRKCSTAGTGGLVVDTQRQTYFWNVRNEWGDVISWTQRHHKTDFKGAVELLCRRFGLPDPQWGRQDQAARVATRQREEALDVAHRVFVRWFWRSAEAKAYAEGRGWSCWQDQSDDEPTGGANQAISTAMTAMLGYSGEGTEAERDELQRALVDAGVDLASPTAVAILGMKGEKGSVGRWAKEHDVKLNNDEWILRDFIPGIFGHKRLVYPHVESGRVKYLSCRSISGKFHYNLPEPLVGKKRLYFNPEYASATDAVIVVEGQADAISWGKWGFAAIALAGVDPGDDLREILPRHKTVYLGLDMDVTGVNSAWRLSDALGPTVRLLPVRDPGEVAFVPGTEAPSRQKEMFEQANTILRAVGGVMTRFPIPDKWTRFEVDGEVRDVKDANDLLRALDQAHVVHDEQVRLVRQLLEKAPTYVEAVSAWAGAREGATRDEAIKKAVAVIGKLDEFARSQYKGRLAKILQVQVRELERMLKALTSVAEKNGKGEVTYTWGGYVDGWLLEYLYDQERDRAMLAWRDPDGNVDSGQGVQIDGLYYQPYPPNDLLKMGSIHFPSALGEKKSIAELVAYLRLYLKSVYIMPSDKLTKLVAYWILETYLYDAFPSTIYLRAMGGAGSGKSELILRIGLTCYRMMQASGTDSTASLFRAVHRYRGTVLIDEADMQYSDTENEMVKFYNQGAFKGRPIMRTREITLEDGSKDWETVAYNIYCPKLIGMRKDFKDDAVGTRSITLKLVPREMPELVAAGIPLNVDENILARAQALRNLLIRFRLENWQPEIPIDSAWFDLNISPRMNQVGGPLLAMARDDPEQQEDIRRVMREYYQETIISQSMTLAARVIEAMWKIWKYPDLKKQLIKVDEEGNHLIKTGDITRITNEIMDQMNETDGDDDDDGNDKKNRRSEVKAQRIGRILREDLQLQVSERRRDGFWVYWNEPRMIGLSTRYGINPEDFGPQPEKTKPVQGSLV